MVGFKTFWIAISALFLLGACVPQTKQSSCGTNEAFNSQLRTCVPIVGGAESFVTVKDFVPASVVSKSKNDNTNSTLSITVANPYNQVYTVQWERIFNATSTPVTPVTGSAGLSVNINPFELGTLLGQVGTHIITAKIFVGTKQVDSHNFTFQVNQNPKPAINITSITPTAGSGVTVNPTSGVQTFSFSINNNIGLDVMHNWTTRWTVTKNNAHYTTEIDGFSNHGATETNFASLNFNPSTAGIGNYTVRATVSNNPPAPLVAEVVDERLWIVTVKYPDFTKITSRNIYSSSGVPSFNTSVIAYNGADYTTGTGYNFIPSTVTNLPAAGLQADFCITVSDGQGPILGGPGVRVDYYLDGVTLIYSGTTSSSDNKVCLSDNTTSPENIIFTNPSPSISSNHTIVARLIDLYSGNEYTTADINSGLGTYPVTWNLIVRPDNAAPAVEFTADSNLSGLESCGPISGNSRTCSVKQDTAFVVGVKAIDDFYYANPSVLATDDSIQSKLAYNMTLYRNGSAISTCSKSFSDVADTNTPGSDFVGPDYLCSFTVPSFDANGPVNPNLYSYSIAITVSDLDSPFTSVGKTSAVYTYNLNPIIEVNTLPIVVPQGSTTADTYLAASTTPNTVIESAANPAHYITEGETLNFSVAVNDAERDHHSVKVLLCSDFTCASTSQLALKAVTKNDGLLTTRTIISYTLPEDLIPVTTAFGTNVPVYFQVQASDSGPGALVDVNVNVRNRNPAPQFGGTPNPTIAAPLTAMVGYPLTIDPGFVSDASLVTSENTIGYQWYVDTTGAGTNFSAITGATVRRLTWTPSNGISGTVNLRLCIHDNTSVNPLPTGAAIGSTGTNGSTGPNCLGNWNVTVRPHSHTLSFSGDMDSTVAVWQDNTVIGKRIIYTAATDGSNIYVNKTVFNANGTVFNDSATGFSSVNFPALASGSPAADTIKDLSITGNADYVLIAYQAAESSNPNLPKIRIRKINKSTANGSKTHASFPDTGKFGYIYDANLPTTTNATSVAITSSPGESYNVEFVANLAAGDVVTVNGIPFTAASTDPATGLCGGSGACTNNGNASKLATLINTSNSRALQGLSAVASGNVTYIYGAVGGQHLDTNPISNYVVGKLGKVVLHTLAGVDTWYLPFVDRSSSNNIRVLEASIATSLNASTTITSTKVYSAIGSLNWFTNDVNSSGEMVIGSVNTSNIAKLHNIPITGSAITGTKTLFGGNPIIIDSLRISSPVSGNNNYFAAAKVLTILPSTYEWKIGRYDSIFTTSLEDKFSLITLNAPTASVLSDNEIVDINLQSMTGTTSSEARLLVSSKAGGTTSDLYAVRLRTDNKLSCGLCVSVNTSAAVLSPTLPIASTRIDVDMAIGSQGAVANENIKDVFFAIYSTDEDSDGNYLPQVSIINAEAESINSTTTDNSGTLGHRPPLFGGN